MSLGPNARHVVVEVAMRYFANRSRPSAPAESDGSLNASARAIRAALSIRWEFERHGGGDEDRCAGVPSHSMSPT